MFVSRETIFAALFKLLCTAVPPAGVGPQGGKWVTTGRAWVNIDTYPKENQPAVFMLQAVQNASQAQTYALNRWQLRAMVQVVWQCDALPENQFDPDNPADKVANDVIDAFDKVISGPLPGERQTLASVNGGQPLAYNVTIDGNIFFYSGLNGPPCFAMIPLLVLVGAWGI